MLKNSKVLTLACIGLGVLLGYAAASGRLNPFQSAEAAPPVANPAPPRAVAADPSGPSCCEGANKSELLVLAKHNAEVQAKAESNGKKPNICIIWGDDIGQSNISAYSHGVMGYKTPNIDRLAKEGMIFTDYYAEQSCTAGRASFITGQHGLRTGLTKVGLPGATLGLQKEDPTIAEMLKPLGLCHRSVRQEPPGRPQRVPAHGSRVRRVLSATSTT